MQLNSVASVGVYHDSDTGRWHFDQIQNHKYKFNHSQYFQKIDDFLNSKFSIRLATYHVAFPLNQDWVSNFFQLYSKVDHSFVYCSELHGNTFEQLKSLDLPNVTIFVCGAVNDNFQQARVYAWMDWFVTTAYNYYTYFPDLLSSKLIDSVSKPKKFDVLLGSRRPNREFVFNSIKNTSLYHDSILTMFDAKNQLPDYHNPDVFIFETDGVEILNPHSKHTVEKVKYHGQEMSISQIVPISIYNQTYYSVVAETNCSNQYNFYTEKTAKPLIAGRLFVAFAGQYFLKNLRKLGFQTFSEVIDESYDIEPDQTVRWEMAVQQLNYLAHQSPEYVLNKIKPVVEHNQRVVNQNWHQLANQHLIVEIARIVAD